jgi:hypothetical protein
VYYTFARTLPPSSKVSKSVVALLLYFKWTKFIIVAGKRLAWGGEVQEAIKVSSTVKVITSVKAHTTRAVTKLVVFGFESVLKCLMHMLLLLLGNVCDNQGL